jgi:hypothetical protein
MKKTLIIISFIIVFILWNLFPLKLSYINFSNLMSVIDSNPDSTYLSIAKVRFCNNSDTQIDSIHFNNSSNVRNINIWECSEYVSTDAFYKYFHWEISTIVDWKRYNYTWNIFCPTWEKLYRTWKHTFYINDLIETEDKVVEYFDWIDYELENE